MTPDMNLFDVVPEKHRMSCEGCDFFPEIKAAPGTGACSRANDCFKDNVILIKKEPIMTHAFKVGDKLIVTTDYATGTALASHGFAKGIEVTVEWQDRADGKHGPLYSVLGVSKHSRSPLSQLLYESELALPVPQVAPQPAKDSAFLKARQSALDAYVDSRKKQNLFSAPARTEGFTEGYTQGFAAGKQAERTAGASPLLAAPYGAAHRNTDPATSQQAAAAVSRKAGKIASLILQELKTANLTGHELSERTGVPLNSVTPRFAQLKRAGLIHVAAGKGRETVWALGNGVAA